MYSWASVVAQAVHQKKRAICPGLNNKVQAITISIVNYQVSYFQNYSESYTFLALKLGTEFY